MFGKGQIPPTEPSLRLKSGRIEEQVKVVASPRSQLDLLNLKRIFSIASGYVLV